MYGPINVKLFFLCQVDLAFLFSSISLFISQGTLLVALWGSLQGVAFLAAFCSILIRLLVSSSTCSWSLSFIDSFAFSCIVEKND
jgi:hypothetical protein